MVDAASVQRLVVLSDLHLAPPGDQCVFRGHQRLVSLFQSLAATPCRLHLVLNGDVFDFLQLPGYQTLSLSLAQQRTDALLDALDREPPPRNLVQALRHFTGHGHVLSILPGNHDPELNLASVQAVLTDRLGSSATALPPYAGSWHVQVAGLSVGGLHGHHADPFNAITATTMLDAQAAGRAEVALPPGSRLVCQVINDYRRARHPDGRPRFPFVDLLPSEVAVVLALLLTDPQQASRKLYAALGISVSALCRAVGQATGLATARLVSPVVAPLASAPVDLESFVWALAADIAGAMTPAQRNASDRVEDELRDYLDRGMPAAGAPPRLAGGGLAHGLLLRALGRALVRGRDSFRPHVPDALADVVLETFRHQSIAIAGHTHAAKQISRASGQVYLNTGTWLDQVLPPVSDGSEPVAEWLAQLADDRLPRWQGSPVAVVDVDGARLLHWDGQDLVPWSAALPSVD